jgi:hypothetical protein
MTMRPRMCRTCTFNFWDHTFLGECVPWIIMRTLDDVSVDEASLTDVSCMTLDDSIQTVDNHNRYS